MSINANYNFKILDQPRILSYETKTIPNVKLKTRGVRIGIITIQNVTLIIYACLISSYVHNSLVWLPSNVANVSAMVIATSDVFERNSDNLIIK